MENIRKEYDAIVDELKERAELIASENKELTREECISQALDDGFMWDDDKAYVLAWAVENGTITWGAPVEWWAIEDMLREDIAYELERGEDKKGK